MGFKGIVILGIFLAMVLLISSEVLAVRELAEISNTINTSKEDKKTNRVAVNNANYVGQENSGRYTHDPLNPRRPFCKGKIYGSCILPPPKPRRCNYPYCGRGPPPSS